MLRREIHQANRLSWNTATAAHNRHKGDQAAFFRAGGSTLFAEELELLGDLRGRSVVHLQCNSGQDTLSLARLGADVTGVDISDTAIDFARDLSAASAIPAHFVRADLYDWLRGAAGSGRRYDVAFCSYGALRWLSDLELWAAGVADVLAPRGRFVCLEFHPLAQLFDERWSLRYDYFHGDTPQRWDEGVGDYVAQSGEGLAPDGATARVPEFVNPHPSYEFPWGLGEVVTGLARAGLALRELREYPYLNGWKAFESMRPLPGRRWGPPEGMPSVPLMYGLAAEALGPSR